MSVRSAVVARPRVAALADGRLRTAATARAGIRPWIEIGALLVGLAAIVGLRWLAVTRGGPALLVGLGFAGALIALWAAGARGTDRHGRGWRARASPAWSRRFSTAVAAGFLFGLVLVAVTLAGASIAGAALPPGLSRPAAPFLPWALVTIAVATAEEGLLRGILFDRLRNGGGVATAIGITTAAFALMHVPLYGWHVLPLDLAVGFGLGGLRLSTRTLVAPAVAHAVADLATWWL